MPEQQWPKGCPGLKTPLCEFGKVTSSSRQVPLLIGRSPCPPPIPLFSGSGHVLETRYWKAGEALGDEVCEVVGVTPWMTWQTLQRLQILPWGLGAAFRFGAENGALTYILEEWLWLLGSEPTGLGSGWRQCDQAGGYCNVKRKRGIEEDSKVFSLNNWWNGAAVY